MLNNSPGERGSDDVPTRLSSANRVGYTEMLIKMYNARGRAGLSDSELRQGFMKLLRGTYGGLIPTEQLDAWQENPNDKEVVEAVLEFLRPK